MYSIVPMFCFIKRFNIFLIAANVYSGMVMTFSAIVTNIGPTYSSLGRALERRSLCRPVESGSSLFGARYLLLTGMVCGGGGGRTQGQMTVGRDGPCPARFLNCIVYLKFPDQTVEFSSCSTSSA